MPYFNLETGPGEGVITAIGWAGQWAAQFTRDAGRELLETGLGVTATNPQTALLFTYRRQR